ncbi:MAG TPA: radical SAM protein, partial [Pyrinomonadaceae bacterium]|nr:radical SAM protein [Pyrinomonadaceae bacterium]
MTCPRFCLVLIKPSHYDDDGYVIQWLRSAIPSNSLAVLYGLALECARQKVLGDEIELEIHAFDETNTRIRPHRIASLINDAGAGMVMLVGVQSNQFPRALDIAQSLRERGIQVAVGGFHVSGTIAMLAERDPHVRRAEELGVSLFAGEAEGRLGEVLGDAARNQLKPLYNFMNDLPHLEGAAMPFLPSERILRTAGANTSLDAGRGCPYQCSFCTIINVQGRKSRYRSADDCERIVRANVAQGIHRFFITDDNFARNRNWEAILDRMITLREKEGLQFNFIIQVDTLCHRLPNFIEKCARAGVKRVFIGLENINPDSLLAARKQQNKITEYRKMLLAWKQQRVLTYCGYILGFPNDTPASILNDIRIIQKELPVDLLEFFYLTPLPGSEDHRNLHNGGAWMDSDINKYDLNHAVTGHPRMSIAEWQQAYRAAWETYYTDEHIATVLRRAMATGVSPGKALFLIVWFKGCIGIEGIHPLEGGFLRLKSRRDRRSGLRRESPFGFYPQFLVQLALKQIKWAHLYLRLYRMYSKLRQDPRRAEYLDLAITP